MTLHLEHCDPTRNRARFYHMEVSRDLFGTWTLQRGWGRIGTNGRDRIDSFPSLGEARAALNSLRKVKTARGYHPVQGQGEFAPGGP